jgi:hypothetical protein
LPTEKQAVIVTANPQPSRAIFYLITLLGCLVFAVLGFHREPRVFHFRDFKQPYASARCVLKHCNPYSESDTEAQYFAAHGPDNDRLVFVPYSALYPPPSLLLLTPVAALSYPAAHAFWILAITVGFSVAALLMTDLIAPYGSWLAVLGLACFVATSDALIMLGQLSGVAIALLVIGLWLLLREKSWAAAVCIAVALCLKPHDVVLFLAYLLIAGRPWRKGFWVVAGLAVALTLVAVVWFSATPATAHWLADMRANLAGNSAPGSVNDPGPLNPQADAIASLQAVFSVFRDSRPFYSVMAYLTTAVLYIACLYAAVRMRNSPERHLLVIAAIACITLLPIYHRQYDTRILLLIFPAIAWLFSRRRSLGFGALVLAFVAIFPAIAQIAGRVIAHGQTSLASLGTLRFLLAYRLMEIMNLALAVFFVVILLRAALTDRPALEPTRA